MSRGCMRFHFEFCEPEGGHGYGSTFVQISWQRQRKEPTHPRQICFEETRDCCVSNKATIQSA